MANIKINDLQLTPIDSVSISTQELNLILGAKSPGSSCFPFHLPKLPGCYDKWPLPWMHPQLR